MSGPKKKPKVGLGKPTGTRAYTAMHFGPSRTPTAGEMAQLNRLLRTVPHTMFVMLSQGFRDSGMMLAVVPIPKTEVQVGPTDDVSAEAPVQPPAGEAAEHGD